MSHWAKTGVLMNQSNTIVRWATQWDEKRIRRVTLAVFAVLAGLLLCLIVAKVLTSVLISVFTSNIPLDMADPEDLDSLMLTVAPLDFALEMIGWVVAIFSGAYCSVRINRDGQLQAWIVGLLMLLFPYPVSKPFQGLGLVATYLNLPHPQWVILIGVPLCLIAAFCGGWVADFVNSQTKRPQKTKSRATRSVAPVAAAMAAPIAAASDSFVDEADEVYDYPGYSPATAPEPVMDTSSDFTPEPYFEEPAPAYSEPAYSSQDPVAPMEPESTAPQGRASESFGLNTVSYHASPLASLAPQFNEAPPPSSGLEAPVFTHGQPSHSSVSHEPIIQEPMTQEFMHPDMMSQALMNYASVEQDQIMENPTHQDLSAHEPVAHQQDQAPKDQNQDTVRID